MRVRVTFEQETDGRWIGEVDELGVLVYGGTRELAYQRAKAAALFALSGRAEGGAPVEDAIQFETTLA